MKIGMVLDQEFPPDMRVENEAVSLVKKGYSVTILSFGYSQIESHTEIYKGISIYRLPVNKKWIRRGRALINTYFNYYTYYMAKQIAKFIKRFDIDILHIHDLYLLGAAFHANKNYKLPIIADLHENYVEGLKHYKFANSFPGNILISLKKWAKKEIEWCQKADYVITVIEEAVERYKSLGLAKDKIVVVANYVSKDVFLKVPDDQSIIRQFKNKFVASYIGNIDIHRGLGIVIKALPAIIKDVPDFHLVFVGGGKNVVDLQKLATELNVQSYISFEGYKPADKLPSYIKASTVCLIPHLKTVHTDNTIPHKLFHYMILEKPVVATNCSPIKRIIEESQSGLIYSSDNHRELTDCILQLYKNPEIRQKMGSNGKKAVLDNYDWESTAKNLLYLYNRINKASHSGGEKFAND